MQGRPRVNFLSTINFKALLQAFHFSVFVILLWSTCFDSTGHFKIVLIGEVISSPVLNSTQGSKEMVLLNLYCSIENDFYLEIKLLFLVALIRVNKEIIFLNAQFRAG